MSFILKLLDDTDTIDFMTTAYKLRDGGLDVQTPKKKQVWGGRSEYSHGAQLINSTFDNRNIRLYFQVTGSTRDILLERLNTVERILERARLREIEQTGTRVELQYQWDTATSITYFEVKDGELRWPSDVMSVDQVHQKDGSGNYIIYDLYLTLEVAPFGYPISPVSGTPAVVPLTNGNGSDVTTGLRVYNHDDSTLGHDNWVEIDGADIEGAFPAIVKFYLESESGEAENTNKIYIGVRKGNLSFVNMLEDDDASSVFGSPSPTYDLDNSSGDYYTSIQFDDGDGEIDLIQWSLTSTQTGNTQGPFRFFGRCHAGNHWDQNGSYAIAIKYGSDILYQSEWRKPIDTTTELLDFGTIYMPPWLVGTPDSLAGLEISIRAKQDSTGTITIAFDYLALMPQDGGYRVLEFRTTGIDQFEEIIDDGWENSVYHVNTSSLKTGLPYGLMPRVTLQPGVDHRIYFLQEGTAKNCEITRQLDVWVYAVPTYNVLI